MESTTTDGSIIQRSLGDPECFATIFDRHVESMYAYLARRAGRDAADGLVGEVFRVAFETRLRYRTDRPSALPWLYGIASNVLRQYRRTEYRQGRVTNKLATLRPLDIEHPRTGENLQIRDDLAAVMEVVMELPQGDRQTVLLYAWEELTYEQIAEALDIPVGTVRSRLNRARSRIREQLEC